MCDPCHTTRKKKEGLKEIGQEGRRRAANFQTWRLHRLTGIGCASAISGCTKPPTSDTRGAC